ncbi:cupin domain-containing protein [Streptomyces sp. NPDC088760]|uniref:cupin domain-containing protein n=1 Tax=Streptomyces sp. NPDC088760 TaxID=3365890 RepID=UPI0038256B47
MAAPNSAPGPSLDAGATGPEHAISREQVWTVTAGALEVTCDGRTQKVSAGQTLVLPPALARRIHAPKGRGPCVDALQRSCLRARRRGQPRTALGSVTAAASHTRRLPDFRRASGTCHAASFPADRRLERPGVHACVAWATIEILRHTGIRIEGTEPFPRLCRCLPRARPGFP